MDGMSRSAGRIHLLCNGLSAIFLLSMLLSCAGKESPPEVISPPTAQTPTPAPPIEEAPAPTPITPMPFVAVKLLQIADSLIIRPSPGDSLIVRFLYNGAGITNHRTPSSVSASLKGGWIDLHKQGQGPLETGLSRASISPAKEGSYLYLNGKPYRGSLTLLPAQGLDPNTIPVNLVAINFVQIEEYLRGVVPGEIGNLGRDEIEAIKVQAVAARTYALSRLGQFAEWGYDLEATVKDQLYLGVEGEAPLADEAIEATRGVVMTNGGLPINAYYHANCGGKTEYIERIWDKPAQPYLIPVEDSYCDWAPSFRWEETWRPEDLVRNLSAFLDTVVVIPETGLGPLLDLRVASRSPSGRVESLEAVTAAGTYTIGKDRIRWAMKRGNNPNRLLRSTLFDIEVVHGGDGKVEKITAHGFGTGHGVGMCQTGAIGMARHGFSWEEILTRYYPGVEFQRWGD